MKLKDLAIKHDYYCSDSNFYSNEPYAEFTTFAEYYEEYKDADIDMNLIFRWDIFKYEESDNYRMCVFMIHQRKGIFTPIEIKRLFEVDVPLIIEHLKQHKNKLDNIWKPL